MRTELRGKPVLAADGGATPDGPTLLLVHGAGNDRTVWQLQTRSLAHHGVRVLAVDLPGHGGSEGPPLSSVADIAGWLAEFIEALDIGPIAVAGHSMGALAALELAATRPDLVSDLVLVGAAASMPVHPALLEAAAANDPLAAELICGWAHASSSKIGGHDAPGMWMIGEGRSLIHLCENGVLSTDLEACNAHQGAVEAASKVTCPTLLILGSEDKMTPLKGAQPLIEALEHAEIAILEGSGHTLMIERSHDVRRLLQHRMLGA